MLRQRCLGYPPYLSPKLPATLAGAIEARPPSWIFADAVNAGVPLPQALLGTIAVIKICGVAVAEPARGSRIGTTLINACTGLYFQLGYLLAYGQFDARNGLAPYYMRLGFDVHAPGAAISLKNDSACQSG